MNKSNISNYLGLAAQLRYFHKVHLLNQLMTEVFVEQPLALPGSAKKTLISTQV